MTRKLSRLVFVFLLGTYFAAVARNSDSWAQTPGDAKEIHNSRGLAYFRKGFHELAPREDRDEAQRHYQWAEKEFRKAIALDKDYIEAHQNLARVYYVQHKFSKAAEEYARVIRLDPLELDAYVQLALTYSRMERYDAAINELKSAKRRTQDDEILGKLDEYIQRLEQAKRASQD